MRRGIGSTRTARGSAEYEIAESTAARLVRAGYTVITRIGHRQLPAGCPARRPGPGHGEGVLSTRKYPYQSTDRPRPGQVLRARPYLVREPAPRGRAESQHRPGTVLRVTHEYAVSAADFHALPAAV